MSSDAASSRRRLTLVGEDVAPAETAGRGPFAATPHVVLMPIEPAQSERLSDFAFELARALAAQTARTGAIVFAERASVPIAKFARRQRVTSGPLMGLRLEPLSQREGVLFFDLSRSDAVGSVVRGQMPQVTVGSQNVPGTDACVRATAIVVVVQAGARAEYVDLLRGELAASGSRPVHVVELDSEVRRTRLGAHKAAACRAQAWTLAAELVLGQ